MSTLYQISDALLAQEQSWDVDGEVDDAAFLTALESVEGQAEDKVDNYAALIREVEARAGVRKDEADRLTRLVKRDEALAKRLKGALQVFFETHHYKTMDTARFRVVLAKHGGKQPIEILVDPYGTTEDEFPEEYVRHTERFEADKDKIREALERGEKLSFARLLPRGQSIRIR